MTRGGSGSAWQPPGRLEPVQLRHADVHEHHVGAVCPRSCDACAAVGGLAHDLDVSLAAEHQRQRRADQRVVVDDQDPVSHAAHGIQPCRTNVEPSRSVLEPTAAQLGALGEADQPEPGPRCPAARRSRSGCAARVDAVVGGPRRPAIGSAPRVRACGTLVMPLLDDPVERAPPASGTGARRGRAGPELHPHPELPRSRRRGRAGRRTSAGGRSRGSPVSDVAQHAEHAPQVGERLVGLLPDHRGADPHLVGGEVVAEGERPGVQRDLRDPVREHVVHLAGDPRPLAARPARRAAPARPRRVRRGAAASTSAPGVSRCTCPSRASPAVKTTLTASVTPERVRPLHGLDRRPGLARATTPLPTATIARHPASGRDRHRREHGRTGRSPTRVDSSPVTTAIGSGQRRRRRRQHVGADSEREVEQEQRAGWSATPPGRSAPTRRR